MKKLIGLAIMIVGFLAALYLGVWVMFIGGIVQFVMALMESPASATGITIGAFKVFFAFIVSGVIVLTSALIGMRLVGGKNKGG